MLRQYSCWLTDKVKSTALSHRPHSVAAKEKRTGIERSSQTWNMTRLPDEPSHLDPRDMTTLVHRGTKRYFSEVKEVSLKQTLPTSKDIKGPVSEAPETPTTSENEPVAVNAAEEGGFHEVQKASKIQTTFER